MMDQYRRIKREHPGDVLFFRLGDFYEMFAEDALEVSSLLNLTLTSRSGSPMCGIPYHAARSYIARLLKHGKKIAVCEQLSSPGKGKGLFERQVVEVLTPGTAVDEDYLEKGSPNYLAALAASGGNISFAYIDLSTGEFRATSFPLASREENIRQELERTAPREILVQESLFEECPALQAALAERPGMVLNRWADWLFDIKRSRELLEKQFGTASLKGFGLGDNAPEIVASGALLDYLAQTAKSVLPHVRSVVPYGEDEFVAIDGSSQRNLELTRNLRDGDVRFSLLEVLDETKTAMGRRLLRSRLLHPLLDIPLIKKRQDMAEEFYRDQKRLGVLREYLAKSPDLERLGARLAMDKAHGKDMAALKTGLLSFFAVNKLIADMDLSFEGEAGNALDARASRSLVDLADVLERGLAGDPSILLTEGNLIRDGYSAELDSLKDMRNNGRGFLESYLEEEREATGIQSLKIRYNRLIGYYFEVTNNQLSKVPGHFIRRQGIAGGERYTTDRLSSLESDINGAENKIVELERSLFLELREKAKSLLQELAALAVRLSEIDVAQSLARAATVHGWTRPEVDDHNRISVIEGRHPVVEAYLPRGEFVPNNIDLAGETKSFILITGPNMAGKSTYLRQAALITIMAQIGSFVPAAEAKIGIADRIFCRVGAQDNLARGESTFLVEMNETAHILHTATKRSLVIMDEVGRGTGTLDGLSIAWAVSEELMDRVQCRTLFATHYHELSLMEHPRMVNRSMEVLDRDGEIIFLRKLIEGAAEESYGLHVARLAGIAENVLARAQEIMSRMKGREAKLMIHPAAREPAEPGTSPLAVSGRPKLSGEIERVCSDLSSLNIDRMTPLEALNRLFIWKDLIKKDGAKSAESQRKPGNPGLFEDI